MLNLDYVCMEQAQKIISSLDDRKKLKDLENNLRKSLGVLQEDGVYAMFLWLEEKDKEKRILRELRGLLNESIIKKYVLNNSQISDDKFETLCKAMKEISKDIDNLLFVKKIFERTLIYALYHAKIGEGNVEPS